MLEKNNVTSGTEKDTEQMLEMQLLLRLKHAVPEAEPEELAELLQLRIEVSEERQDQRKNTDADHAGLPLMPMPSATGSSLAVNLSVSPKNYPPQITQKSFLTLLGLKGSSIESERSIPDDYRDAEPFGGEIKSDYTGDIQIPEPLMRWQKIWPTVHRLFRDTKKTQRLDLKTIIRKAVRQERLTEVPWLQKRCWPSELVVVVDASEHLAPFFNDFRSIAVHLLQWFGRRVNLLVCLDAERQIYDYKNKAYEGFPVPLKQAEILYIGDLGFLSSEGLACSQWYYLGKMWKQWQSRVETLLVAHSSDWDFGLRPYFQFNHWDGERLHSSAHARQTVEERGERSEAQTEQLLSYLSWAVELSPALVRAARSKLGFDVSVESRVMQHPALIGKLTRQWQNKTIRDAYRKKCGEIFGDSANQRHEIWAFLQPFESHLPVELQIEQRQHLEQALTDAQRFFIQRVVKSELEGTLVQANSDFLVAWIERIAKRSSREAWNKDMHKLYALYWRQQRDKNTCLVPEGIDVRRLPEWLVEEVPGQWVSVRQVQNHLEIRAVEESNLESSNEAISHSEVARIFLTHKNVMTQFSGDRQFNQTVSVNGRIALIEGVERITLKTLTQEFTFKALRCPSWASSIGRDGYGLFVEVEVKQVTFVMRWIPPGTFLMGSPDDELGRDEDEGPQQKITFEHGFWLAETTCTQELWQVVMGGNPSDFTDDAHNPVENVGWRDSKDFINVLNELIPALKSRLPSEAEWEYACRAGTDTAFWFGDELSPDEAKYVGEYPYNNAKKDVLRGKTLPVKSFRCNPWGLYQMHGNVWEWCEDEWQNNHEGADPNGRPRLLGKNDAEHVCRGGSWLESGWCLRSAYRDYWRFADGSCGFRLARGPEISS